MYDKSIGIPWQVGIRHKMNMDAFDELAHMWDVPGLHCGVLADGVKEEKEMETHLLVVCHSEAKHTP
jgi:hypothetical protein